MADKTETPECSTSKISKSTSSDPSLDFYSEHFQPLKALQSSNVVIPKPNARTHDNIFKYESSQLGLSAETSKAKSKVGKMAPDLKFKRKFLPHQMPIQVERKAKKNLVTKMENFKGPLATLKRCVDERTRLKVWTRHSHGIRGYCLAYLSAFDKHWNLALEDVTEVWTRPRKRKIPALESVKADQPSTRRKIMPPKVVITKVDKKFEYCERHIPQFVVRGEQIAFINLLK